MNYITDNIKQPIKNCLISDEMFKKTFFTFDSLIKVRENVFNTRKKFIGINIERTPSLKNSNFCNNIKANAELVIAYHCRPDLKTNEDELTVYGLKILKLIETSIQEENLFKDERILLSNGAMTVGRMWDNMNMDKAEVLSDAAVVTYDIEYPF